MNSTAPDITIIVPLLNEACELPELLSALAGQQGVALEVILCDGGSTDGSQQIAAMLAAECRFPVKLIRTERGRGKQMNAGAGVATADLLLFLHADSRFEESHALLKAGDYYRSTQASGTESFAARFGLHFRRSEPTPSLAYFYYEAKARLPRPDCIRGDQGFLLNRKAFREAGGFDETLPFLEDLRLVAATAPQLKWRLLPATVSSSARRFEQEGLLERQILNAIIVNNTLAGWSIFFETLPDLYRSHCRSTGGKMLLFPILDGISRLLERASAEWRRSFWRSTGRHVAANAWQLFYWLDTRHAFRSGNKPEEVQPCWLDFYQRRLERFFQSRYAAILAQMAVRLWLRWMLFIPGIRGTRRTA
ncbi:MAG: TIGR04283 family arsenosugar biosynthesis glycosyltransferase [Steroidobacteraceae bacterium]|nr:TIGR04283 family arsenosugar biosynthesis glycosyltransferase [Deltaproteobacteria bacterium]